jgi:sugar/nucleoside kinase (ribokinase family)
METDTNYRFDFRGLCQDSIDAIEWAIEVNAENGEQVGFRLVGGTRLETDTASDALDAADYIEREAELLAELASDDMRHDIGRIRRAARAWRGGKPA